MALSREPGPQRSAEKTGKAAMTKTVRAFNVTVLSGDRWLIYPAIEYEGGLWFAPKFRMSPDKRLCKLDLLVRFDNLNHGPAPGSGGTMHLISAPIPAPVLDGEPMEGFEIRFVPDLVAECPPESPTIQ